MANSEVSDSRESPTGNYLLPRPLQGMKREAPVDTQAADFSACHVWDKQGCSCPLGFAAQSSTRQLDVLEASGLFPKGCPVLWASVAGGNLLQCLRWEVYQESVGVSSMLQISTAGALVNTEEILSLNTQNGLTLVCALKGYCLLGV